MTYRTRGRFTRQIQTYRQQSPLATAVNILAQYSLGACLWARR